MPVADVLAALLIGIAGSSHCVFMCGGIHGALVTSSDRGRYFMPLFNLGRIVSYAFFGLLAGSLGLALQSMDSIVMPIAKILAGLLLLAMAAYIGRWWQGLTILEKIGTPVWQIVQPYAQQLMPVRSAQGALAAGAIWGWLPCGLVYSTLAWAMLANNPLDSAGRMFFFGLGTIPALLGTGLLADAVARYLKTRIATNLNAILLVLFALWTMWPAINHLFSPHAHQHGGHSHRDVAVPADHSLMHDPDQHSHH